MSQMITTSPRAMTPSTPSGNLRQFLDSRADNLAKWVRGRLDPASLIRFAVLEYSQNEKLRECSPESIYLALIACAQVGLEPSGIKQEAFIVPFKGAATFMPGYRGLIKLALRSGAVKSLVSHPVYEHDTFEIDLGTESRVVHRPALRDRGRMIGAYALAKLTNGEFEIEWMPLEDLEKIRKSAERGGRESPAYSAWADQMYRKAPIRRLCKRLPMGDDYYLAARLDEATERGDFGAYRGALDAGDTPALDGNMPGATLLTAGEAPSARGAVAEVKRKLAKRPGPIPPHLDRAHAATEPAPSADDDLEREVQSIEAALARAGVDGGADKILERARRLPPGDDRERLERLALAAALDAHGTDDDVPEFLGSVRE